jgi:hypothetical protein
MKNVIVNVSICLLCMFIFSLAGCADNSANKQEFIAVYNEYSKHSPPALGEGVYPLTANFRTEDKGNEGKAQALVDIGFLRPDLKNSPSTNKPVTFADNIVTFHLTELGKKYYDTDVKGFSWGNHSAFSVSNFKILKSNGQKIAYVTLKTKIANIPDWAKQPIILANYPIVRETLNNNEFRFNAVYKLYNNRWLLAEVSEAFRQK